MFLLLVWLLFSAAYACLFTYLGSPNFWLIFAWVPTGILSGLITEVLILYLYLALIGQHTKNEVWFKHLFLKSASEIVFLVMHMKITVEGKENIPNETFVIYGNHKSDLDPFVLYYFIRKKPLTAVGKKSLFQNHLMKVIGNNFKAVVMDRDNDREAAKTMVKAIKQVKEGMNMIIFPEGGIKTRDVEEMVNLRAGAYKLAMKPGAAILPCAIIGSSQIAKKKFYKRKDIKLIILKPLYKADYEGMNTTEVGKKVEEMINNTVKEYEKDKDNE